MRIDDRNSIPLMSGVNVDFWEGRVYLPFFYILIQFFEQGVSTMLFTEREQYIMLRKKKGIRLNDIARAIQCSVSLLSKYENGKCEISTEKARKYKEFIDRW